MFTIRKKIFIGLGLLLFLVSISSLTSYISQSAHQELLQDHQHSYTQVYNALEIKSLISELFSTSPDKFNVLRQDIRKRHQLIESSLADSRQHGWLWKLSERQDLESMRFSYVKIDDIWKNRVTYVLELLISLPQEELDKHLALDVIRFISDFVNQIEVLNRDNQHRIESLTKNILMAEIFIEAILFFIMTLIYVGAIKIGKRLNNLSHAVKEIDVGAHPDKIEVSGRDEITNLAGSFVEMIGRLNATTVRLVSETATKTRMEVELNTAKLVQEALLPSPNAELGNVKISGFNDPATECGGDWWHYTESGDYVYLWIGDVTGHGAPAALITAAAKTVSAIVERTNVVSPRQIMDLLNHAVCESSRGKVWMTFFLAKIHKESGHMTYCKASHLSPILMSFKEGAFSAHELIKLDGVNGSFLGESSETRYEEAEIQIHPGDKIYFYTDGVTELTNGKGTKYGERRLFQSLAKSDGNSTSIGENVARLRAELFDFRGGDGLKDDITFFAVEFAAPKVISRVG